MNMIKLGTAFAAGGLFLAIAQSPVLAKSPMTDAFLANITPNVDFLDRSSRFAMTNSSNAKLKGYAKSEAREATMQANALDAYIEGDKSKLVAVASTEAPLQTGRSVAVDGAPKGQPIVDDRLPMGQEDLDRLEGLNGAEFDTLYKEKQLDALTQVETDYAHYIQKGDDPVILTMANRELPKIRRRLAELKRM